MTDWRETRKQEIDKFEANKEQSIKENLKILPDMHERAKNCHMSTEDYLEHWILSGLAPDSKIEINYNDGYGETGHGHYSPQQESCARAFYGDYYDKMFPKL